MANIIRVKRGDKWSIPGVRTDSAGAPVSLSGSTIAAQMKNGATTIDLTATITNASAGAYELTKSASQTNVPILIYKCDIEFTTGDVVNSSETFLISVEQDITNAG